MKRFYCIGIKGSGMSTLASILHDLGHHVSGYDDYKVEKYTEEGLKKRNIEIFYDDSYVPKVGDIITASKAFSRHHPELRRLRDLGFEVIPYGTIMGELSRNFFTVGIAGTHGKTTTTYLTTEILKGKNIAYFIGDGTGKASPESEIFIMESDEFNKHFLAYNPKIAVITNIDLDHLECYPGGLEEIQATFKEFAEKAEIALINKDDPNSRDLKLNNKVVYFGTTPDCDIYASNIDYSTGGISFDVIIDGEFYDSFKLNAYGKYMIYNSLIPIYLAKFFDVDKNYLKEVLKNFKGAKRRFINYEHKGYTYIDDYAHQPTEIKAVINAARQKYPNKKIIGVFLPNSYSRTRDLFDEFTESFKEADKMYLMKIKCDREDKNDFEGVESDLFLPLVKDIEMIDIKTVDKLLKHKDDVILFMSCTSIFELEKEFLKKIDEEN